MAKRRTQGLPSHRIRSVIALLGMLALPGHAQAGAQCDGTVAPNGKFVKAGGTYTVTKGGTTYICVACGSCRPLPSGQSGGGASGMGSTRSMIGNAVVGGFLSGFQQGMANAQAEREREAARAAARAEAERIRREQEEIAQRQAFERQKQETLGALKGFSTDTTPAGGGVDALGLKPLPADNDVRPVLQARADNGPGSGSRALRDARCAARESALTLGDTSADSVRAKSERAMQGAGADDCAVTTPKLPIPSSEAVQTPEVAARIAAAEARIQQLAQNRQALAQANARREQTLQKLAQARQTARTLQAQPGNDAQQKARAALEAAARLERELAEIERTIGELEKKNAQLSGQPGGPGQGEAPGAGTASGTGGAR
ncbi:MAG: hypothetical protein AB1697_08325 [Pseudomonadota bacterium]